MTFSEILRANETVTNLRGKNNCFIVSKKIHRDNKTITFFVRTIKQPQDGGRNLVSIKPKLRRAELNAYINDGATLAETPIQIFCTCKAYKYWGIAYNLSQRKNKLGAPERIAPDIRDPERIHHLCKHCAKVYYRFKDTPLVELYSAGSL